jgi:hypothetical protein
LNSGAAERFAAARREFEEVSRLLLDPTPAVLELCRVRLSNVVGLLQDGRRSDWPGELAAEPAAGEARLARRALLHTRRLLEKAAKFHAGWQRVLAGCITREYRADGSVPELPCPRHVYLQG